MPRSRKPTSIPTAEAPQEPDFICFYRPTFSHSLTADAERGDADAQFALGRLYLEGRPERSHTARDDDQVRMVSFTPGVPRNQAEAVLWLQRAADQGHVQARRLLAVALAAGKGWIPSGLELLRR